MTVVGRYYHLMKSNHQNHVAENLGEPEVTQNEKYESETCQVLHASEGYS